MSDSTQLNIKLDAAFREELDAIVFVMEHKLGTRLKRVDYLTAFVEWVKATLLTPTDLAQLKRKLKLTPTIPQDARRMVLASRIKEYLDSLKQQEQAFNEATQEAQSMRDAETP